MIIKGVDEFPNAELKPEDAKSMIGKPFFDLSGKKIGEVINAVLVTKSQIEYTIFITDERIRNRIKDGMIKHLSPFLRPNEFTVGVPEK